MSENEKKPNKFTAHQALTFWNACMESKRAEAMATFHSVPSGRGMYDERNGKFLQEKRDKIVEFLRDMAKAIESIHPS
jgi:hypothetical protein